MKRSRSIGAFVAALSIHLAIAGLVWLALAPQPDEPSPPKPTFSIRFGESDNEEESPDPSSASPAPSAIAERQNGQTNPSPPSALPERPLSAVAESEHKAFSEADRESLPFSVLHHYGEEFFTLSAGEQHYIIDNLQRIRKINEIVGTRLLRERPDDVDPLDNNVVEFTLHPDGTISDLHLEKNRIGTPLDELTLQTINLAHPRYPKPDQPTKIRIRVYIIVK